MATSGRILSRIFQTIPHFSGSHPAADDVILSEALQACFLQEDVLVFEKMDGINVTLRLSKGRPTAVLKPKWQGVLNGQVERALGIYIAQRRESLQKILHNGTEIYGEWLWHRLCCSYDALPSEFIGFGAGDKRGQILSWKKSAKAMENAGVVVAEPIFSGKLLQISHLKKKIGTSQFGPERMEGVIVQRNRGQDLWAKWVEAGYVQPNASSLSGIKNKIRSFPQGQ